MKRLICFFLLLGPIEADAPDKGIRKEHFFVGQQSGVVKDSDFERILEIFAAEAYLDPFPSAATYFACFSPKKIKYGCRPLEENMAEFEISAVRNGERHAYGLRHGIPLEDCLETKRRFRNLLRSKGDACLQGIIVDQKQASYSWVWDKLRTKKGMVAFFGE